MELLERIKTKIEDSEQENGNFFLSNPYSQNLTNLDLFNNFRNYHLNLIFITFIL